MKVYVCQYEWGIDEVTASGKEALAWMVKNLKENTDEDFIQGLCEDLHVNDIYDTSIEELTYLLGYYFDFYVTICELEDVYVYATHACKCEHETEQQPKEEYVAPKKHTYLRRSL